MNLLDIVSADERLIDEKSKTSLAVNKIEAGKTVVTVVDRIIKKSDGTEMFEYLGSNATTIGGTQTIVENIFDNLDPKQLMDLTTVDQAILPDNWSFDNIVVHPNSKVPRKIFGVMVADDGAVGTTHKIVNRRTKGFDIRRILPFRRMDVRSDSVRDYMQIGEPGSEKDISNATTMAQIRRSIDSGKYAMRVNINSPGFSDICYLSKLLNFNVSNILVDGSKLESNDSTRTPNLDVRTKVETRIDIDPKELSSSFNHNNGTRETEGSMISSFMLVAGRPVRTLSNGETVDTYGDVIVTNRINFIEIPVEETTLSFRYVLYYV